jgi:pilus assembly protein FimV
MRAASTLTAIGAALWLVATAAHAVGFGRITNLTQLGQPLNFAAVVRLEADEALPRECVSAEVQSGENRLQAGLVRVTLEGAPDSSERSVRVTTSALIDEPVVTVSVTLGCNTSKVTRRFVAFIDPPLINMAQAASVETLPPQRRDSQVAPLVSMVQGEGTSASAARRGERAGQGRSRPRAPAATPITVAEAPSDAAPAARSPRPPRARKEPPVSRQVAASRSSASGARLQLEAPAPIVAGPASAASAPTAPASLAAAEPASASRPDDTAAQLAKERVRIQALEEGVAKLRSDAQSAQASLAAVQLRLQEAEAGRYANPLVYALAWLSALLALAVAGLWWRQARARQPAQWWSGPAPAPAASNAPLAVPVPVSAPAPLGSPSTEADAFAVSTVIEDDEPANPDLAPTRPAPFVATAPASGPNSVLPELPRELSVEELIDLEQQVEFFIVLGQDDAAIELLMSHVRSDGGISPLPYLKLLEIYRRRGELDGYQRIRDRFNRRFNAYAPAWEADLQQGRSLVDYPDTIAQLQQLWASPVRAMETLDASLFRRNKTDETFDLPAYRELLFLYSVARDLAEHAGVLPNTSVDLLLPLGDPGEEPIARLSANTQPGDFQNSDLMTMPLDLDVSFGPGATQDVETMPSALRRSGGSRYGADSNFLDFDLDLPAEPVKSPKAGGNR